MDCRPSSLRPIWALHLPELAHNNMNSTQVSWGPQVPASKPTPLVTRPAPRGDSRRQRRRPRPSPRPRGCPLRQPRTRCSPTGPGRSAAYQEVEHQRGPRSGRRPGRADKEEVQAETVTRRRPHDQVTEGPRPGRPPRRVTDARRYQQPEEIHVTARPVRDRVQPSRPSRRLADPDSWRLLQRSWGLASRRPWSLLQRGEARRRYRQRWRSTRRKLQRANLLTYRRRHYPPDRSGRTLPRSECQD